MVGRAGGKSTIIDAAIAFAGDGRHEHPASLPIGAALKLVALLAKRVGPCEAHAPAIAPRGEHRRSTRRREIARAE